ncbi:hypothetical protein BDQ12DRAFT_725533 [Crucibulum laeve]|uniref:Uncharacterized protein n=1 Tax=Crucibulum laeve TaxID=68775 RepID=A0A5C3LVP8_9AGAR|nr:hypothetical protein BDQ12DRAFT_725533 [Crucibulum laeve]
MDASSRQDLSPKRQRRVSHPADSSSPSNAISLSHVSVSGSELDDFSGEKERGKRKQRAFLTKNSRVSDPHPFTISSDTLIPDPDITETPPCPSSSHLPRSFSSASKSTPKSAPSSLKRSSSTTNLYPSHRAKKLRRPALLSSRSRATSTSQPFDTSAQFRLYVRQSPPHAPTTFLDSFSLKDMDPGPRVIKQGVETTGAGSGGYDATEAKFRDIPEHNSSPASTSFSPAFALPTISPNFIPNTDRAGPYIRAPLAFAPVSTPQDLERRHAIMQISSSPSSVVSSSPSVSMRGVNK